MYNIISRNVAADTRRRFTSGDCKIQSIIYYYIRGTRCRSGVLLKFETNGSASTTRPRPLTFKFRSGSVFGLGVAEREKKIPFIFKIS